MLALWLTLLTPSLAEDLVLPRVDADALRGRVTPVPALPAAVRASAPEGTTLTCPVMLTVNADGTVGEVRPTPGCDPAVAELAQSAVSGWTYWPPLADGRNQAVQAEVRLAWTVVAPEPIVPERHVAGRGPRQLEALAERHVVRPNGSTACRLQIAINDDGTVRARASNRADCLVDADAVPPPTAAWQDIKRTCDLKLTTTAGRAGEITVRGCGRELRAWAHAAASSWTWIGPTDDPTPIAATIVLAAPGPMQ